MKCCLLATLSFPPTRTLLVVVHQSDDLKLTRDGRPFPNWAPISVSFASVHNAIVCSWLSSYSFALID